MVANDPIQSDKQFLLECRKPKKAKKESSRKRKSSKALKDLVGTSNPASPFSQVSAFSQTSDICQYGLHKFTGQSQSPVWRRHVGVPPFLKFILFIDLPSVLLTNSRSTLSSTACHACGQDSGLSGK